MMEQCKASGLGRVCGPRPKGALAAGVMLSALAALGVAGFALAQEAELPAEATISLDLEALLLDQRALPQQVSDSLWSIQAPPGRRLIALPLVIEPGASETELSAPPISMRGGRFLCWWIVDDTEERNTSGRRLPPQAMPGPRGRPFPPGLPGMPGMPPQRPGMGMEPPMGPEWGGMETQPFGGNGLTSPSSVAEPPRLTRRLTISPNRQVHWELDRFIPNAEVRDPRAPYALKIRPDLLAVMEPQRPGLPRQGRQQEPMFRDADRSLSPEQIRRNQEQMRQAIAQQQQAQAEYRQQSQEFLALRRQVQVLPTRFDVPLPQRLWAVFEVVQDLPDLSLGGPEPLPWQLSLSDWATLREAAQRRGGNMLDAQTAQRIARMALLAQNAHPLTHRMLAHTLAAADLVGQAQPNDTLYRLIQTLATSPDAQARRLILQTLATTPPTTATQMLLREAAAQMDPATQLLALRNQLSHRQQDDPREMIRLASSLLIDAQGPDAGQVLQALVETLGQRTELFPQLTQEIDFGAMPPARRDQAIAYVIHAAGTQPLAAAWLNHKLLGAGDPQLAKRTLQLLASASGGPSFIRPLAQQLMAWVFGPPSAESSAGHAPDLSITAPIPLDSTRHHLYRYLNSGDPELYRLAWEALPHFQIAGGSRSQPAQDGDPLGLILEAALGRQPTPPQVALFLARQPPNPASTQALMRVVIEADSRASALAGRLILGSGRSIQRELQSLSAPQRGQFAARLYEAVRGQAPLVAGLLADPGRSTAINWFAQQIQARRLPEPSEWVQAFNSEQRLLELAASPDPAVAAGAVAALVASAGGDNLTAQELAQRFAQATDRSARGLEPAWRAAKQEIYIRRLSAAAGSYRLTLLVRGQASNQPMRPMPGGRPMPPGAVPPPPGMPPMPPDFPADPYGDPFLAGPRPEALQQPVQMQITLGVVELIADGQSVRLGSQTVTLTVPQERLAIRIAQPHELKNFQNEQIAQLPLDRLNQPLDLLPQPDGSWRGGVEMLDGRVVELWMEPIEAELTE